MDALTVYHRGSPVLCQPLARAELTIGADAANDLILTADGVADRHLVIFRQADGRWRALPAGEPDRGAGTAIEPGTRLALGSLALELAPIEGNAGPASSPPGGGIGVEAAADAELGLVGSSPRMRLLRLELKRLAPLRAPVLIHGETGTGKELAARALHECSSRQQAPFVAINCGALTPTIVEDILFGHERGSFTGAAASHRGVFERARGGTLFLDEIGELPLPQQATLLRVLDDGRVCRLGGEREEVVQVRLVAATNRDLGALVEQGEFREDLYHRLAALRVETPALRDRPADIAPLARLFLAAIAEDVGPRELAPSALERLAAHAWPGNARELRNVLYRAAVACPGGTIRAADLQLERVLRPPQRTLFRLDQLADGPVEQLLQRHRGNIAAAARELGVARSTLRDRIKRLRREPAGALASEAGA